MPKPKLILAEPTDVGAFSPVLAAVGSPRFAATLLDDLHDLYGVVEVFAHLLATGESETHLPVIARASRIDGIEGRTDHYCTVFHRYDPITPLIEELEHGRIAIYQSRLRDRVRDRHRLLFSDRPGLNGKVSLVYRDEITVVLNLYWQDGVSQPPELLARLERLAPTMLSVVAAHHKVVAGSRGGDGEQDMEIRLARLFPTLPLRERQVCARTVSGMTAQGIASDLAIGMSTVVTYRRRAYERLGIRSAYQLLGVLIDGDGSTPVRMPAGVVAARRGGLIAARV